MVSEDVTESIPAPTEPFMLATRMRYSDPHCAVKFTSALEGLVVHKSVLSLHAIAADVALHGYG